VTEQATTRSRATWGAFDRDEVRELYDDYAAHLDAGDYDAWLGLFTEEATYTATARENIERGLPLATIRCDSRAMLADRLDALVSTQFFVRRITRHMITAIRPLDHEDGALTTTANFVVVETIVDEPSRVHSAGSYEDRVVHTDAGLRFAVKLAVYDSPLVPTSLIVPL
jgi:salicylate 5-hydroxylase small subunit